MLTATLLFSLFGCSGDTSYSDSVPCDEILDKVEEQLPVSLGYESYGADYTEYYFKDLSDCEDLSVRYSTLSENLNEFGIFHARDKNGVDGLCEEAESYLETLLKEKGAFIASYAPDELSKLEDAEVRTYGNYVAYAILSKDDRALFFEAVGEILKHGQQTAVASQ